MIYAFDEVTSTNDLATEGDYRHGDVVWALSQSAGRGQRGHNWSSRPGKNLTMSLILEPNGISVKEQFLIAEIAALAIVDTLSELGIGAQIKWTNDIYVGDKKICGVLIENRLSGSGVARSVVGIGLNIGQNDFPEWIPNPTSVKLLTDKDYTPEEVLALLHAKLMARYDSLVAGGGEEIEREYNSLLYRRGEEHTYTLPDGTPLRAILLRVERDGRLWLTSEGKEHGYHFGEIFFQI